MIESRDLENRMVTGGALRNREASEERFVTPSQMAEYWNVHVKTVYRDIRKGALPVFRLPGRGLRIRWSDMRRYGRPVE